MLAGFISLINSRFDEKTTVRASKPTNNTIFFESSGLKKDLKPKRKMTRCLIGIPWFNSVHRCLHHPISKIRFSFWCPQFNFLWLLPKTTDLKLIACNMAAKTWHHNTMSWRGCFLARNLFKKIVKACKTKESRHIKTVFAFYSIFPSVRISHTKLDCISKPAKHILNDWSRSLIDFVTTWPL